MPSYVHAHLNFLLLTMIGQEPRNAHSVRRELRERFGARSTPSPQRVYSMLHYLERNRLIRPLPADPRRYLLTVSGRRSLEMRTREWKSFAKGAEALLHGARRRDEPRGPVQAGHIGRRQRIAALALVGADDVDPAA
jgi:DNA-binding PadR family transcriptional regulator